ncbi:MAG TPA: phosphoglycerate kinase [Actinobacteria bacterium]|nr:phosphoglycerate kinase [Actinomycetota bacterium]
MEVPTLDDLDVDGRTVLLRADLNVPIAAGEVEDDFRIRASLPTLRELRERARRVIVASHLGRPGGVDPSLSLAPVTRRLGELGGFPTVQAPAVVGPEVAATLAAAPPDAVVVLENTRFEPGETKNDPNLAEALAVLADRFVNDAFGTAHRAHASTVGVAERLPSAAGRLLEAELAAFDRLLHDPDQPYVVVMGGAKLADKLGVMRNLLPKVDLMLVGGGMCFTLLAAEGYEVGDSLVDEDRLDEVRELLEGPEGSKVVVPYDVVVADRFAPDASTKVVPGTAIPEGWMGLDVGPETVTRFGEVVRAAESVFWNGPMGVFEWKAFRAGTAGIAEAVAACEGYTVVGGGDSVAALRALGLEHAVSHLSSGGGAGLALLEGRTLPAVAALERWRRT